MKWISKELKFLDENSDVLTKFQMAIVLERKEADIVQAFCRFDIKHKPFAPSRDTLLNVYKAERDAIANQRKELEEKGSHKTDAQRVSRKLIVKGEVEVRPCEWISKQGVVCGETKNIHRHHEDYSKPKEFIFLCYIHHFKRHKEINREKQSITN